jgi:hypothetical protein
MNDLIQRIVNAIIRQEGEGPLAFNPGNLRAAPWLTDPDIAGGFWVPESRAEGVAGLAHLVALHTAEGNTLRDFIAGEPGVYGGFAPGSDGANKPDTYIADVMQWADIDDQDAPLWEYIEP